MAFTLLGVFLQAISFHVTPGQPLWRPTYHAHRERPPGPLDEGEEVLVEAEGPDGQELWWTAHRDGGLCLNPLRYGQHRLTLACAEGPSPALVALEAFLNASWLQADEEQTFLSSLRNLHGGEGVNLREEGQVLREGDVVLVWPEMTYLAGEAPLRVSWAEFRDILDLNLEFLDRKAGLLTALAALPPGQFPVDEPLPQYRADLGFFSVRRGEADTGS